MSIDVPKAHVRQFSSNLRIRQQQFGSRLRGGVDTDTLTGKFGHYESIKATAMTAVTSRHMATPQIDTPHEKRRIAANDFVWADLIDEEDEIRMLIDPESKYAINATNAANRTMDDEVIAAFFATATIATVSDEDGTTAAFDSNFQIANGSADLTVAKLIEASELLDAAENPDEDRFIATQAKQRTSLLNETEVTSSDFNTVKALVRGEISEFMGFTFLKSQRLAATGSDRRVPAWWKFSMMLATSKEPTVRIDVLPAQNYSTQVHVKESIGAVRMDEVGVIEILCTEA